ncbi:MAG TPA: D-aminoacylase [Stellaceae bacterium]|nr:D-aminoacylase [Stellaceae bacterium]HUC11930.1 D-aminoacylase [Stellaceae bacterium]
MTDFILRGGEVIDGSGKPRFRADVAITGDRIAEIGAIGRATGAREIDVAGKIVAPGFIDVHTHDDRALFATPDMAAKASQGVTTVVTGNCGISLAPLAIDHAPPPPLDLIGDAGDYHYRRFADYLADLDRNPSATNAACLVGHSTLRVGAMSALDRPAEAAEIERMRELLQEALDAGAVGMSSGLAYAPAEHAPPAEIEALAALLRPAGALYTTHMRNEGEHVLASLEESFAVGRAAGVPVVISHHKTIGRANFGRTAQTLPTIAAAIAGQEVGLDAYPYIASSTVLSAGQAGRATKVLVTWSKSAPDQAGRELSAIAADWGVSTEDAVARLQPAGAIYWTMDEADVQRVLSFPHTMIGSDGLPHDTHPHPRLWGTFPRVLGHYCRDLGLFGLEEAVRRMTGLPAARFGLSNRGALATGAYADIVVFDQATIIDRASFEQPTTPAAGIEQVFVNGRPVWTEGKSSGERPGRALRRQGMQAGSP